MNSPIALVLLLAVPLCTPLSGAETRRPDPQRYAKDIARFDDRQVRQGGIVFTGSSSIRLWTSLPQDFPDLPVLNLGFGGSIANDLSAHFNTLIARTKPRLVVTYTGGNDLNAKLSVDEAFADYIGFLERVHRELPQTRVLINSVKIAASRAAQIPQVHALNARLEAWAKTQDWARYIDTTSYLADEQGRPRAEFYRKDRLHLNDEGYRRWKSILEPVLREEWAKASAENP